MKVKSVNSNEVIIVFKVWCPHFNKVDFRLYLLGSLPELGAWSIDAAKEAQKTADSHTWTVEVAVPTMVQIEWVWVKATPRRTNVEWERPVRRIRTIDCFSGTIHTVWGVEEEVFQQFATHIELSTFMVLDDGFTMVLTGNSPTTGSWDLKQAVPAQEFPKKSGYWKVQIAFDALTNLEFKWAVVKEKDRGALRVQEKEPHSIYGRQTWMRAVAPWMTTMVVVVDTNILTDLSDTKLGRTDIIVQEKKKRAEEIKKWLAAAAATASSKAPSTTPKQPAKSSVSHPAKDAQAMPFKEPSSKSVEFASIMKTSQPSSYASHAPTVQRSSDLDEHIKQRQENLSKTERLIKQLNKEFKSSATPYAFKGLGQTTVPAEAINTGVQVLFATLPQGESRVLRDVFARARRKIQAKQSPESKVKILSPEKTEPEYNVVLNIPTPTIKTKKSKKKDEEWQETLEMGTQTLVTGNGKKDASTKTSFSPNRHASVTKNHNLSLHSESASQCGASQSITQCSASLSDVLGTSSDTGVADLSSLMSTLMVDNALSESPSVAAKLTEIPESCLTAHEELPDIDEGYSESETLHQETESPFAKRNYWESMQFDLSPLFMDKILSSTEKDITQSYLAEDVQAWDEDGKHLNWLESKVKEEDNYFTSVLGAPFLLPPDHPFMGNSIFESDLSITDPTTLSRQRSSPERKTTRYAKVNSASAPEFDMACKNPPLRFQCSANAKLPLTTNSNAAKSSWVTQAEDDELVVKRQIARALERQWGAKHTPLKEVKRTLTSSRRLSGEDKKVQICQDLISSTYMGGAGEYGISGNEKYKMAYYSCAELSDATVPPSEPVDHRAKAREMERSWGESQHRFCKPTRRISPKSTWLSSVTERKKNQ